MLSQSSSGHHLPQERDNKVSRHATINHRSCSGRES